MIGLSEASWDRAVRISALKVAKAKVAAEK